MLPSGSAVFFCYARVSQWRSLPCSFPRAHLDNLLRLWLRYRRYIGSYINVNVIGDICHVCVIHFVCRGRQGSAVIRCLRGVEVLLEARRREMDWRAAVTLEAPKRRALTRSREAQRVPCLYACGDGQ